MKKQKFKIKDVNISKVVTKTGDQGFTSLIGGDRVSKDSLRIKTFGEVDELNSLIGSCVTSLSIVIKKDKIKVISSELVVIQHELFNLGNMLATVSKEYPDNMPQVNEESVNYLEKLTKFYNKDLDRLKSFVLPGGNEVSTRFHIARTVCRRCERSVVELCNIENVDSIVVVYLNRLSDFLFIASRWIVKFFNDKEILWNPNFRK